MKRSNNDDYDRFEDFIDGLGDVYFQIWYHNEASDKQKAFADSLRHELNEDEQDMEDLLG